jgi:hypothetical protein
VSDRYTIIVDDLVDEYVPSDLFQEAIRQMSLAHFRYVEQLLTKEQTMNNVQSNQTKIDLLTAAITNGKKVEIDYTDLRGEKTTREITVQNVAFDSGTRRWNVSAVCHLRGGVRTFVVDSITAVRDKPVLMVSLGERVLIDSREYVVANTGFNQMNLIAISSGARWTDSVTVENITASCPITKFTSASLASRRSIRRPRTRRSRSATALPAVPTVVSML